MIGGPPSLRGVEVDPKGSVSGDLPQPRWDQPIRGS